MQRRQIHSDHVIQNEQASIGNKTLVTSDGND